MTAKDYPITTPYGQVAGYPLNNGFHNGIDYGAPEGTPVVVNGVTIGLSGWTGAVYDSNGQRTPAAAHLHVGRWIGGKATNPGNGGFTFDSAVVTEVSSDPTNGNFVRIQADGASWVYLHLSKQLVSVGQVLNGGEPQEEDMTKEQADKIALYARLLQFMSVDDANKFNASDTKYILENGADHIGQLLQDIYNSPEWQDANSKKSAFEKGETVVPQELKSGIYKVN